MGVFSGLFHAPKRICGRDSWLRASGAFSILSNPAIQAVLLKSQEWKALGFRLFMQSTVPTPISG